MSTKDVIALGGVPRADLLPPEIRAAQRGKATVRRLIAALVLVVVLTAAGIGYAVVQALTSQVLLAQERLRTETLLAQQLEFAEARSISNEVAEAGLARQHGMSTEIDWNSYLDEVTATLPQGVALTAVTVDSISPLDELPTSEAPLTPSWVATLSIQATSNTVPDVESWLIRLESLTGFAEVAPPVTVTGDPAEGYQVSIQVLVNADAFALRYLDDEAAGS